MTHAPATWTGALRDRLAEVDDAFLENLSDTLLTWASINSHSGHPTGLARMRAALAEAFAGVNEVSLEEQPSSDPAAVSGLLVACRPEAPFQVLLSGHFDTVYPPDDPFQEAVLPDSNDPWLLQGPGVADMKGGLLVMLQALRWYEELVEAGAPALGWRALLTPDEEIGSAASRAALEAEARTCRAGLVFEPALPGGNLVRARRGSADYRIEAHGTAAHTGRAFADGRNAIELLCRAVPAVQALNPSFPGLSINVGRIAGGGALNVVPDHARADLNLRPGDPATARAVAKALAAAVSAVNDDAPDGLRLELVPGAARPAKTVGPAEEALFARYRAVGDALGLPGIQWTDTGGGSDGNLLAAAGLPVLDGAGIVGGDLHSPAEWARVDSVPERAARAAALLLDLASGA